MLSVAYMLMELMSSKSTLRSRWARSQIRLLHRIIREQDVEGCKEFLRGDVNWKELLPIGKEEGEGEGHVYLPHHLMFYHLSNNMNIEILQMLLDSGLDPNFGDRAGRTALHCLIRKMHYQKMFNRNEGDADQLLGAYMKTLLVYGANPNAQDVNGSTPMHSAAIYNYPGCSSVLKQYGGNVEMEDSRGMTPFLKAVEFGSFQVMQELASLGVNVHRWDNFGKTALHAMGQHARMQRMQCMKFLMGYGLDVNQQDNEGNTCLHLAARSKAPEDIIVELLLNGADANILNNLGRSPLYEYLDNEYLWTAANCSYIVLSYSPEKGSFPKTHVTPGVSSFEGLCCILDNTTRIRVHNETGELPLLLRKPESAKLTNFLIELTNRPLSLKFLSRQAIRRVMGQEQLTKVEVRRLEIPKTLQIYIYRPICSCQTLMIECPPVPRDKEEDNVGLQNVHIGGWTIVHLRMHELK